MREVINRLIEQRNRAWNEAKALLDAAEARNEDLSAEERASYDRINTDLDAMNERIEGLVKNERRMVDVDRAISALPSPPAAGGSEGRDGMDVEAELRAIGRGEQRAMTVGTSTAGGNTVGNTFVHQLYQAMQVHTAILQANPTLLETTTGELITLPTVTGYSTAAQVNEGGTLSESDPTFGQATLSAYKFGHLMGISRELIDDNAVNLTDFMATQAGIYLGDKVGQFYVTGTGSSQPQGVITAANTGVTGGTGAAGAFTADNLIDLFYSVIPAYRAKGTWLLKDSSLAVLRKFKATTNEYLWQPSLAAGQPDTFMGRPVLTDPAVPAVALSAKSVAFGDFSQFYVRRVNGVRVESSIDYSFNNDLVYYRVITRTDSKLLDANSIKLFAGGAT